MGKRFGKKENRGMYDVYPYSWKEIQEGKRERNKVITAIIALLVIEASVYVCSTILVSLLNN